MATGNFYNKNASCIFAVLTNEYYQEATCSECGCEHDSRDFVKDKLPKSCCGIELEYEDKIHFPDCSECDDFQEMIKDRARGLYPNLYVETKGYISSGGRLDSTDLFMLRDSKPFMGVELEVQVAAVIRSGYYEGANLDWEYMLCIEGIDYDFEGLNDSEHVINNLMYYGDNNRGLARANYNRCVHTFETMQADLVKKIESIFSEYAEHKLQVYARFSNGETMYAPV